MSLLAPELKSEDNKCMLNSVTEKTNKVLIVKD